MIVAPSARKHGISDEDAITAARSALAGGSLDDENPLWPGHAVGRLRRFGPRRTSQPSGGPIWAQDQDFFGTGVPT